MSDWANYSDAPPAMTNSLVSMLGADKVSVREST